MDLLNVFKSFENAHAYGERNKAIQLGELGSFLAMFPVTVQKILAPQFYQYFCQFFAEKELLFVKPIPLDELNSL